MFWFFCFSRYLFTPCRTSVSLKQHDFCIFLSINCCLPQPGIYYTVLLGAHRISPVVMGKSNITLTSLTFRRVVTTHLHRSLLWCRESRNSAPTLLRSLRRITSIAYSSTFTTRLAVLLDLSAKSLIQPAD
ncbi:hypothetical protein EG68_06420 [Paragonimus skrjabini miyazakii]|uniref:Uncharacterized protein n=1 Tax=Paragonimus skrjabini miyazakii TaxID=59628 RepID=A0A8S9YNZ9_9TREM|nr:hypothetical protein EG68_06420 [Paragonimus skrjabini miyazakii]